MFGYRDHLDLHLEHGDLRVEVAFTDATLDLQGGPARESRDGLAEFARALGAVEEATGSCFARMSQVHGTDVVVVTDQPVPGPRDDVPVADALVTDRRGAGLMVRVADCVPVLLADPATGVTGVAHAGRHGVRDGVVARTVASMRSLGARGDLRAWIGPHVCAACYEVPAAMRDEVATAVPATRAVSAAGTPALDLGAGVGSQLAEAGVDDVVEVGGCTREDPALHSYRRDGAAAGRLAGMVWTR